MAHQDSGAMENIPHSATNLRHTDLQAGSALPPERSQPGKAVMQARRMAVCRHCRCWLCAQVDKGGAGGSQICRSRASAFTECSHIPHMPHSGSAPSQSHGALCVAKLGWCSVRGQSSPKPRRRESPHLRNKGRGCRHRVRGPVLKALR